MGSVRASVFTTIHQETVADGRWPLVYTAPSLWVPGPATLKRTARCVGKTFAALLLNRNFFVTVIGEPAPKAIAAKCIALSKGTGHGVNRDAAGTAILGVAGTD